MVWFYQRAGSRRPHLYYNFQSHFGLILSISDTYSVALLVSFNPILVWFYLRKAWRGRKRAENFQSHFGLILSRKAPTPCSVEVCLSIPFWSDFIPTDRQKRPPRYGLLSIPFWSDFIIEEDENEGDIIVNFQSHFGLILSRVSTEKLDVERHPFNPILVWFYQQKRLMNYI